MPGIVLGLMGVYLIVANGLALPPFSKSVAGSLLITLALMFEAASSIIGKGLVARYSALSVVTYQMLSGAIALAPFSIYELSQQAASGHALVLPPAAALWSLLYLIVPCTVFGYIIWFTVLDKREAGEMSVFLFIQPVAGAFLAAHFLGDKITPFTLLGAGFVLAAVLLVNLRPANSQLPPTAPTA